MSYHESLLTVSAFAAGFSALVVTVVVLARSREGTKTTAWLVAALSGIAGVWSVTLGLRLAATSPMEATFWLRAGYVVAVPLPTIGVLFAIHQTRRVPLSRLPVALFAVEPTLAVAVAVTNPIHGLYLRAVESGGTIAAEPGIGFLLHGAYCAASGLIVIGLFGREARHGSEPERRLGVLLGLGAVPPTVSIALFVTDSPLVPAFDTTPIWLAGASLVVLAAVRGYGLFDVSPVAYRAVFQEVEDPILVADESFRVVEPNPAAREAFGAETGTHLEDVFPAEASPAQVAQTDERTVVTYPGEPAEYEVTVTDVSTDERACVFTFRDITERRRVERRFRTYVEQSNDVLVVVDTDGDIEYVSDAARRTFGHDPDRLVGRSVLGLVHPDDREAVTAAFREAVESHHDETGPDPDVLEGPPGREDRDRRRFRVLAADGGWRTAEAVVAVGGGVAGERLLVNLRDVTDQQRYEQRLRVLNRVLRHDLRNDANVVVGYADLLVDADLPAGARERAKAIRQKATRLVELGEQARAVDRTLHAASDETQPVELGAVIEEVASQAREAYPAGTVETTCPADVYVEANELLASAVRELVANAVEHNDAETPWVRVSVTSGQEWVYVTVTDDGPGIPESERAVLNHGTETALEHGSGLGLWLVTWIVDAVDGDVSFAERTPRGSEVTLRLLPADQPAEGTECDTAETDWVATGEMRGESSPEPTDSSITDGGSDRR